jgi:uroporphyrinogen decarboxylase
VNSRERILHAIGHREPDRIPVDFAASTVTGISAIAYNALKDKLGIKAPTRVFDVVQQLAMPEKVILDRFATDAIDINMVLMEDMKWYPVKLGDGSEALYPDWYRPVEEPGGARVTYDSHGNVISRMPAGGSNFDQVFFPWEAGYPDDMESIHDAFRSINWVAHSHSKFVNIDEQELRSRVSGLRESSDRALVMSGGAKFLELGFFLRRMDHFLMDLYVDPKPATKLLDKLLELHLAGLEKKIRAVGDLVDVIRFGDDLGMTTGPLFETEVFRRYFKPRYTELCNYVKQHSNMKIFFHSCGGIRPLIPDLIESGFDILNPVQTNCEGMDAMELKREFGKDITFWGGGVDTSSVLPAGTPDEVRRDVLTRCEILGRDGGFVFAPIHNIVAGVPPENVITAYDTVKELYS